VEGLPLSFNNSKDGQSNKTNALPQSGRVAPPLSHGNSLKGRSIDDAHKHSRCKSVPTPLNEVVNQNKVDGSGGVGPMRSHDMSCPASPTGCSNSYSEDKKLTSSGGLFASDSVDGTKPKKTIFEGLKNKNTLKKSKDGKLDSSYANSVEEEAEPNSEGSVTPPNRAEGTERLDNEQNAVSGDQNALS